MDRTPSKRRLRRNHRLNTQILGPAITAQRYPTMRPRTECVQERIVSKTSPNNQNGDVIPKASDPRALSGNRHVFKGCRFRQDNQLPANSCCTALSNTNEAFARERSINNYSTDAMKQSNRFLHWRIATKQPFRYLHLSTSTGRLSFPRLDNRCHESAVRDALVVLHRVDAR